MPVNDCKDKKKSNVTSFCKISFYLLILCAVSLIVGVYLGDYISSSFRRPDSTKLVENFDDSVEVSEVLNDDTTIQIIPEIEQFFYAAINFFHGFFTSQEEGKKRDIRAVDGQKKSFMELIKETSLKRCERSPGDNSIKPFAKRDIFDQYLDEQLRDEIYDGASIPWENQVENFIQKNLRNKREINNFNPKNLDPVHQDSVRRQKSDTELSEEIIRSKRLADYQELQQDYLRCKRENHPNCEEIFQRIVTEFNEMNARFSEMRDTLDNINQIEGQVKYHNTYNYATNVYMSETTTNPTIFPKTDKKEEKKIKEYSAESSDEAKDKDKDKFKKRPNKEWSLNKEIKDHHQHHQHHQNGDDHQHQNTATKGLPKNISFAETTPKPFILKPPVSADGETTTFRPETTIPPETKETTTVSHSSRKANKLDHPFKHLKIMQNDYKRSNKNSDITLDWLINQTFRENNDYEKCRGSKCDIDVSGKFPKISKNSNGFADTSIPDIPLDQLVDHTFLDKTKKLEKESCKDGKKCDHPKTTDIDHNHLARDPFVPIPKVHEELTAGRDWEIDSHLRMDDLVNEKLARRKGFINQDDQRDNDKNNQQQNKDDRNNDNNQSNQNGSNKNVEFIGASGPFLSLCEQFARQHSSPTVPLKTQNSNSNNQNNGPPPQMQHFGGFSSGGPSFQAQQFTSRGPTNIPITGETMKASANVIFNPSGMNFMTPFCFFAGSSPQFGMQQPHFGNQNSNQGGGFMFVPNNQNSGGGGGGGQMFPTGGGNKHTGFGQGVNHNYNQGNNRNRNMMQQPYFCTFLPTSAMQFPGHYTVSDFRSIDDDNEDVGSMHLPTMADIIYATYGNQFQALRNRSVLNSNQHCPPGQVSCINGGQCIPRKKWCDSSVDCLDSSDETVCSCRSRLDPGKVCDGYPDCPEGEDEWGCFGCDNFSFSCYNNAEEFEKAKMYKLCFTRQDKCDGFHTCPNGKDEQDCSMIARNLGQHLSFRVSFTDGFLYRNHKGQWYPVCQHPVKWAREACSAEIGDLDTNPIVTFKKTTLPGYFISPASNEAAELRDPVFTETCVIDNKVNAIVRVICPPVKCGLTVKQDNATSYLHIRSKDDDKGGDSELKREKRTDNRVVGGSFSAPLSWPFMVVINKDGKFHCGGIIHTERWIISAAHCYKAYQSHYFEARAGLLRRESYAAMVQTSKVTHIIIHEGYDRIDMKNDIALLRVENPFQFNRWVRPICLPSLGRSTLDAKWIWGPKEGTLCTALGWGSIHEKGPDSDVLRQVQVPILAKCKHKEDQEGAEICAGEVEGGRDACQGDSGGPLLCRSVSNSMEWYLAGIISHGEGCARQSEPGVYTRVALFLDWINHNENEVQLPVEQPKQECPGFVCIWGGNKCIPLRYRCNRVVNCLGGEDEVDCTFEEILGAILNQTEADGNVTTEKPPEHDDHKGITDSTRKDIEVTTISPKKLNDDVTDSTRIEIESTSLSPKTLDHEFDQNEIEDHTEELKKLEDTKDNTTPSGHQQEDHHHQQTTEKPSFHPLLIKHPKDFICRKILQKISFEHRCDKKIDCEDGTDEEFCTCRDYLISGNHKELICDGKIDCDDLSDEANCFTCSDDEFKCSLSRKCIKLHSRCDDHVDCSFKEDELDCWALTNGKEVFLDVNTRPVLNHNGFVTRDRKGTWKVLCNDVYDFDSHGADIAGQVCIILGLQGYSFYNKTVIHPHTLEGHHRHDADQGRLLDPRKNRNKMENEKKIESNYTSSVPTKYNSRDNDPHEVVVGTNQECLALYVECVPHAKDSLHSHAAHQEELSPPTEIKPLHPIIQPDKKPFVFIEFNSSSKTDNHHEYHHEVDHDEHKFSWNVDVFVDGNLKGMGVLVDKHWIITGANCVKDVDLNKNYVTVLLGSSKSYFKVKGPHEQNCRVDCIHHVPKSNIVLLHLEHGAHYNRYVLPTFCTDSPDPNKDPECAALAYNKYGHLRKLRVKKSNELCHNDHHCYSCDENDVKKFTCNHKEDFTQTGIVVCKASIEKAEGGEGGGGGGGESGGGGWYPSAFYNNSKELCAFHPSLPVVPLAKFHKTLEGIIEHHSQCEKIHSPPVCHGYRCPLGKCLDKKEICDGKIDCRDGSDENEKICEGKKAHVSPPTHFICHNGKFVHKTKFCDGFNDCGDSSDEPYECSCITYLNITDPSKICDGIFNCADKSDENPQICKCHENSFRCGSSNICVPREAVCNSGIWDCPNGEDEKYCYGVQYSQDSNDGYGEVIEQSYGIWHTKCFPRSSPPNQAEIEEICQKLGYNHTAHARVLDDRIEKRVAVKKDHNHLPATKVVNLNTFSSLKLNKDFTIYLRPSRASVKLVQWEQADRDTCYRLEIQCE